MRKLLLASVLSLAMVGASCHGSFGLFNRVQDWNGSLGGKWVNSVVHFALWVVPAYEICLLGDILVFNTLEFWTGSNPVKTAAVSPGAEDGSLQVAVGERTYELRPVGTDSVSVWAGGVALGLATLNEDGSWLWQDELNRRTVPVAASEARDLLAMLEG